MGARQSLTGAAQNLNICTEMSDVLRFVYPLHVVQRFRSEGLSDRLLVGPKALTN